MYITLRITPKDFICYVSTVLLVEQLQKILQIELTLAGCAYIVLNRQH